MPLNRVFNLSSSKSGDQYCASLNPPTSTLRFKYALTRQHAPKVANRRLEERDGLIRIGVINGRYVIHNGFDNIWKFHNNGSTESVNGTCAPPISRVGN